MDREANIHSIRVLEKQIAEGNRDIIKLRRTRNSLLNISTRVPPEILGYIFVWSLPREEGLSLDSPLLFEGIRKGSYNFLLVCHHWFEVASRTPELWGFWGNTLQDWRNRHLRSKYAPLDLVLCGKHCDIFESFDQVLQDAVHSRVMQGAMRRVHLRSHDVDILTSIVSSLTPDKEGIQNQNIESIVIQNDGLSFVDVSKFFTWSRIPKLRLLELTGNLRFSSWDCLSRTTLLTALSLDISEFSPSTPLTISQLFSVLTSNPSLEQLILTDLAIPHVADESTPQVPLRNLDLLSLTGEFRRIFALLRRLGIPETLDSMYLSGFDCTMEEVNQTLVPYIRNHYQRDARFQETLGVCSFSSPGSISISVNAIANHETKPIAKQPTAAFTVVLADLVPPSTLEQLLIDLIKLIPREHVVSFNANALLYMKPPEELFLMMPSIKTLYLSGVEVSKGFLQPNPDGPRANKKLLPFLRALHLEDITLTDNDWSHLTTYLAHQTSDGQTVSLQVFGDSPFMSQEVVDEIRGLVEEFTYEQEEAEGGESACSCSSHDEDPDYF
jgi:hypothetical protein